MTGFVTVLLLLAPAGVSTAFGNEPTPWPQVDVPPVSDYTEARQLLVKKKWEEASIVLRSVVKKNPTFTPAAVDLARALTYAGRREEALGVLGRAALTEKGTSKARLIRRVHAISKLFLTEKTFELYQDGINFMALRHCPKAMERFEKALEFEPDNVEILAELAKCQLVGKDYDSASERLKFANRLDPFEPELQYLLAQALMQRGELSEAVKELTVAKSEVGDSNDELRTRIDALLQTTQARLEERQEANP